MIIKGMEKEMLFMSLEGFTSPQTPLLSGEGLKIQIGKKLKSIWYCFEKP
jgi:hypothetical protein